MCLCSRFLVYMLHAEVNPKNKSTKRKHLLNQPQIPIQIPRNIPRRMTHRTPIPMFRGRKHKHISAFCARGRSRARVRARIQLRLSYQLVCPVDSEVLILILLLFLLLLSVVGRGEVGEWGGGVFDHVVEGKEDGGCNWV